ncbi:hypothetical protein SAMN05444377_10460 [Flavobacterium fontis]|uniref:Uncharacterized protein n=1 Tax=Flavobacterium fontis TaxID=1124188 RepID=A0A1M4Z752_9FLAO|nr:MULTISPECIES: hypothetical protein [Flavobacterium]MCZ8168758.1 hypothetical protein [Flavobacterium sp.]MCZ8296363.1 hypothetical protein [Flavobacterium sp.]SHF13617.1 hypothetical protein SAMN05444377_10460 [Flavobacterium fontis]
MKKRHQQKLLIITLVLGLGFNLPLVLLFDSATSIGGFPLIYVYIFSLWLFASLITLIIVKRYHE